MNAEHKAAAIAFGVNGRNARVSGRRSASLRPDSVEHLGESLKKQWKRYRRELRQCQKHFSAEAVHRSRVATRRLLSAVELLAPFLSTTKLEKAQCALKCHLDIFDDLRDTQVQLVTVRKLVRAFAAARAFREYLRKREARFSKKTRKAIKRVKTERLAELIAACRSEVAARCRKHSAGAAAALLLRKVNEAFARTLKLRVQITAQDPRTIHNTRVAFKQFRYMVEALADDLCGLDPALLEAMHQHQSMMGEIQDNEVLLQAFDKFGASEKMDPRPARRLRQELVHRRKELIRAYLGSADELLDFWADITKSAAVPRPARRATRRV